MKLATSLTPWLALALSLAALSIGTDAVPTSANAGISLPVHPISAERLTHSTPRRMDGFQRMLERRYKKQQLRLEQDFAATSRQDNGDMNVLSRVLAAVHGGLSTQQGIGSTLAKYVEYLTADTSGSKSKHKHDIHEPAYYRQPLDHFDNTTEAQFDHRFFYSTRHYKPAAARKNGEAVPIYILDSGEADARARIPFLDTGILDILAKATGGIGIVLEHRYYGTSLPNRTDLGPGDTWGVDQLRWLTNKQALEDSAEFIRNLHIRGRITLKNARSSTMAEVTLVDVLRTCGCSTLTLFTEPLLQRRRSGGRRVSRVLLPHCTRCPHQLQPGYPGRYRRYRCHCGTQPAHRWRSARSRR